MEVVSGYGIMWSHQAHAYSIAYIALSAAAQPAINKTACDTVMIVPRGVCTAATLAAADELPTAQLEESEQLMRPG